MRKLANLRLCVPRPRPSPLANIRLLGTASPGIKPRVVILGSGWGGFEIAKGLHKDKYDVEIVSPANHFLFTPLLPSTAVGTLEFRCIQEPVRTIKGLGEYYQAKARDLDLDSRTLRCREIFSGNEFDLGYDFLIIACGAKTNTFGTPGVEEREGSQVQFLKHLYHSRKIRNGILECLEMASVPTIDEKERKRLCSFVVVGGGPTSCEFCGELHDFVTEDCMRWFPELKSDIKISLVEAGPGLLGSFNEKLSQYVLGSLRGRNVDIKLNTGVVSVEDSPTDETSPDILSDQKPVQAILSDGSKLPFGLMVWSAGLKMVKFVEKVGFEHDKGGRILVDRYLQIPEHKGRIFAIGDCAAIDETPLPPLAKVAQQQGAYLVKVLNGHNGGKCPVKTPQKPFKYFDVGSMAQIGGWKGVLDLSKFGDSDNEIHGPTLTGFAAWLTWRSAYWGKQVSLRNKIMIPMHWFKSWLFGRDICRF